MEYTEQRLPVARLPKTAEIPAEIAGLRIPTDDWRLITSRHPNVLVEGPKTSTELLIKALGATLNEPTREWTSSVTTDAAATLVVRAVDTLNAHEQRRLLDCLNGSGGEKPRQVIASATTSLFPLIERGLFLSDLYYKLNTVRLEV